MPNIYRSAVQKKLRGEKLNGSEEMLVMVFERTFGKCEPVSQNDFLAATSDENEYIDYANAHTRSIETSLEMMSGAIGVFPLDYNYLSGGVIFFDKTHPQYPDMLIVVINDSGEADLESETLAMKVATRYLDKRYHFIHKASIIDAMMVQHICPNPDCANCSSNRDTPEIEIPYQVRIECSGGTVPFYAGSFDIALKLIQKVLDWKHNVKPQFKGLKKITIRKKENTK